MKKIFIVLGFASAAFMSQTFADSIYINNMTKSDIKIHLDDNLEVQTNRGSFLYQYYGKEGDKTIKITADDGKVFSKELISSGKASTFDGCNYTIQIFKDDWTITSIANGEAVCSPSEDK
ncbi:hypothetical protein QE177_15310 (plasmid) [Arsenophonus sp. aPb]|uniref:hypothetical protein n=1 Tax=Arsenophonus sp. aPb TaxID=3041619 RepID=UPI002468590A|nr:hypothetical protein [Arsenophonus sp. aPb]WGL99862.1 hypothetical protein QE177_15310 [Arsenophonus sp. aPb]